MFFVVVYFAHFFKIVLAQMWCRILLSPISVEYACTVLRFKFHQNQTINGRVIQDFVKFKMAAAAILNVAQNHSFHHFSVKYALLVLRFKFRQNRIIIG